MSFIYYKFKSNIEYDTVKFDGLHISLEELREQILTQKKMTKSTGFTLQIVNSQTKEEYKDKMLIPKNTSVIITRVPLTVQQQKKLEKLSAPKIVLSSTNNSLNAENVLKKPLNTAAFIKDYYSIAQSSNLEKLDVTNEQERIKAMMQQATQDFDPNTYHNLKFRMAPPAGYICYRCHIPGHWIQYCPNSEHSSNIGVENRIKRSTGIPKSFMTAVVGPEVKGALLTNDGQFAIPWIEQQAYSQKKIEPIPFLPPQSAVNTPVSQSLIQDHLISLEKTGNGIPKPDKSFACIICGRSVMINPTIVPCCGQNYCLNCISKALLENEDRVCPACHESEVNVKSLIPNPKLAHAIDAYNEKLCKEYTNLTNKSQELLGLLSPQKPKKVPLLPAPIGNVSQQPIESSTHHNIVLPNFYPTIPPNYLISYPTNNLSAPAPTSLLMPVIPGVPYESKLTNYSIKPQTIMSTFDGPMQKPPIENLTIYENSALNDKSPKTNFSHNINLSSAFSNEKAAGNIKLQTTQNLDEKSLDMKIQITNTKNKLESKQDDNAIALQKIEKDHKHYNERSSANIDARKSLTPLRSVKRSLSRGSAYSYSSRSSSVYPGNKIRTRIKTEKIDDNRRKEYKASKASNIRVSRSISQSPFRTISRSPSSPHHRHKNKTYTSSGYHHRQRQRSISSSRRYSPSSRERRNDSQKSPPRHSRDYYETVDGRSHYISREYNRAKNRSPDMHTRTRHRNDFDGLSKGSSIRTTSGSGKNTNNKFYSEAFYHNVLAPALALAEAKKRAKLRANVFADEFNRTSSYQDVHHKASRNTYYDKRDDFQNFEPSNNDSYPKDYQSYEERYFDSQKYNRYHDDTYHNHTLHDREERVIYGAGKTSSHQHQSPNVIPPKKKGPLLPIPTDEYVSVELKSNTPVIHSSFDDKELVNRNKTDEKVIECPRKQETNDYPNTTNDDPTKMDVSMGNESSINVDHEKTPLSGLPVSKQEVSNQSGEDFETNSNDYKQSDLRILDEYTRNENTTPLLTKSDSVYVERKEKSSASSSKTDNKIRVSKTRSPKTVEKLKQPRQRTSPVTESNGSKVISLVKKVVPNDEMSTKSHKIKTFTSKEKSSIDQGKTVLPMSSQDPKRYRDLATSSLKRTNQTEIPVSSVKDSVRIFGARSVLLKTDDNFKKGISFGHSLTAGGIKNPPKIKVILHKNQKLADPLKSTENKELPLPNTPKQLSSAVMNVVKPTKSNKKSKSIGGNNIAKNMDELTNNYDRERNQSQPKILEEPINNVSDAITLQDPHVTASDNVNYTDDTFDIHVKDDYEDLNFEESSSTLNQTNSLAVTQTSRITLPKKEKNIINYNTDYPDKNSRQKHSKKHKKKHKKDKRDGRTHDSGSRKRGHKHKSKKEKKRSKNKRSRRSSS